MEHGAKHRDSLENEKENEKRKLIADDNYKIIANLLKSGKYIVPIPIQIKTNDHIYIRRGLGKKSTISLYNGTSNQAAYRYSTMREKCAILNFANSHHAGGGYLRGSMAQEEELCRTIPELYASLSKSNYPFKWWEELKYNNSLNIYGLDNVQSGGQYTLFKTPINVSIITAAAPNLRYDEKQINYFTRNIETVFSEIKKLLRMCIMAPIYSSKFYKTGKISTLILGAFGCGAFAPNAVLNNEIKKSIGLFYNEYIAHIFCEILLTESHLLSIYDNICFAIPNETGQNYKAFKTILERNLPIIEVKTISTLF